MRACSCRRELAMAPCAGPECRLATAGPCPWLKLLLEVCIDVALPASRRVNDPSAHDTLKAPLAIAPDAYDVDTVQRQVLVSQRWRLLIRDVDSTWETPQRWSWKVRPDADWLFVRGGGLQHGEYATKARAVSLRVFGCQNRVVSPAPRQGAIAHQWRAFNSCLCR